MTSVFRVLDSYYLQLFTLGAIVWVAGFLLDNVAVFTIGGIIYVPLYARGIMTGKVPRVVNEPLVFTVLMFWVTIAACADFALRHF